MKKVLLMIVALTMFYTFDNVAACGEIKELSSSIGTVTKIDYKNYVVTVPQGTEEVTLTGETDYSWVLDYEPRTVSTKDGKVELKVDGFACGSGVYTYFVDFKERSNLIAENDPTEAQDDNQEETSEPEETDFGILYINELKIPNIEFDFKSSEHTYNLEVDGSVNKLNIQVTPESSDIKVKISDNANDLKEGMNKITIELTNSYGSKGLYILNIQKNKRKSSNNYLASLTISKYQLNFDPSITDYEVEIGKESVLDIKPVVESELASYTILGNANLSTGSTVTVRVTAENGETKDYNIKVKRGFNILDYWMYIAIVLCIILLLLLFAISKKKKNKKKPTGPATVDVSPETAGVVQEVSSQNQNSSSSATIETLDISEPKTPGKLQMIEPTDIDVPANKEENTATNEDGVSDSTEVFKL